MVFLNVIRGLLTAKNAILTNPKQENTRAIHHAAGKRLCRAYMEELTETAEAIQIVEVAPAEQCSAVEERPCRKRETVAIRAKVRKIKTSSSERKNMFVR